MQRDNVIEHSPIINKQASFLHTQLASGQNLLEVEQDLFRWLIALGLLILQLAFDKLLEDFTFCQSARDSVRPYLDSPMRSRGKAKVGLRTLFGPIVVSTTRWVRHLRRRPGRKRTKRRKTGTGMLPVLWALGIRQRCTPALQQEITRSLVVCSSSREATDLLACRGIKISHKDAARITYDTANRSMAQRDRILFSNDERVPQAEPILEGRRVVVSIDGGRFKARERRRGRRRRSGRRPFSTAWREPKGFIIYVLKEDGKPDQNVPPLSDFTIGNASVVMRLLTGYLKAYGIQKAALLEVVADGASWIWDRVGEMRVDLQLDAHGVELIEVLDFYHAAEHIASIAELVRRWSSTKKKRWFEELRHELRYGSAEDAFCKLDSLWGVIAKRRHKAYSREVSYFEGHLERLRYPEFESRKLILGSGAIESAIRRVINQRVKGNSIFWCPENAEALMHARAQLKFGRFDDLVARATACHPFSAC